MWGSLLSLPFFKRHANAASGCPREDALGNMLSSHHEAMPLTSLAVEPNDGKSRHFLARTVR
jgi:hypothetical protein